MIRLAPNLTTDQLNMMQQKQVEGMSDAGLAVVILSMAHKRVDREIPTVAAFNLASTYLLHAIGHLMEREMKES